MNLEIVTWRDAYFSTDQGEKSYKDYLVQTVGWTKETKRFLVIRGEKLPHKEGYRAITKVPVENIIDRQILERKKKT